MKFIGVVILLTLFSNKVIASENPICKKVLKGYSICKLAKANSEAAAPYLPSKIDSTTTIYGTTALDNIVTFIGFTDYTKETLKDELGGNSPDDIKALSSTMKKIATQNICNGSPPTKDFINAGGVVVYRMGYADKTPFVTYQVDNCN